DGANPSEAFGTSVSGLGDLDGDGVPDLLVGAPIASPGGVVAAGRAEAFSGASGGTLLSFQGAVLQQRMGSAVSGAGDVNADGVPDLILGAPSANFLLAGIYGPGQAGAFSGTNGGILLTFTTTVPLSLFGAAVAAAGDMNGDGHADLLVGAPG